MATPKVQLTPIEPCDAISDSDPGFIAKLVLRIQPANTEADALAMLERFSTRARTRNRA